MDKIKALSILDKDYLQWIKKLSTRFRRSQVKASVKVNQVMLRFYWELGRDIVEKKAESRWGSGFMKNLSRDLKEVNPDATCFSETNLLYMKNFYLLYQPYLQISPQAVEQITPQAVEQRENAITPQLVEQIQNDCFLCLGAIIASSSISLRKSQRKHCSLFIRRWRTAGAGICC